MTDERDDLDRALSAGLADLAPAEPDATSALASMRPRMQRARTRHRVLQGSAVAAVVLVLGVGAALASPSDKRAQVQVTNPPSTQDPADRSRGTSTTVPDSTTLPSRTSFTVDNREEKGPDPTTIVTTPLPTNAPPVVTSPATPAPTVAPDPGSNHTYNSDGGRVTVRFQNGNVSLVSYTPATGFTAIVHANKPDDVEVRFRNGDDDETRVRVRVVDGRLQPETHN